jgi:segregation and condensation protein B
MCAYSIDPNAFEDKNLTVHSDVNFKKIIEGAIMASPQPLTIDQISKLFLEENPPSHQEIKRIIQMIAQDFGGRGMELKEVANGYRFQTSEDVSPWIQRLWQGRPVKYSKALLETLALIVYKQPMTRAEIEQMRGVTLSSEIIKTLLERKWIKILGYKETLGKPILYGTTKQFLDDFNLKSLTELPALPTG